MRHMKRSSVELLTENIRETGCLEHAFNQNTFESFKINLLSTLNISH